MIGKIRWIWSYAAEANQQKCPPKEITNVFGISALFIESMGPPLALAADVWSMIQRVNEIKILDQSGSAHKSQRFAMDEKTGIWFCSIKG